MSKVKRAGRSSSGGRQSKAASIFLREERKSGKRQALADALAANLRDKFAKNDPDFDESIVSMTHRLVMHTQRRIMESDIVALEAVVKKMSQERVAKRGGATKTTPVVKTVSGASAGPAVQQLNESKPHSGAQRISGGGKGALPSELQGQDEWVLLNALTLVEFEKDKDKEKVRQLEKQRMQRAWLDAQRAEKESLKSLEKQQQHKHFERQVQDIQKWQSEESFKKQKQQEQIMKVRAERDEQLRQQKIRLDQAVATKRKEEEAELRRAQHELQRQEEDAHLKRLIEHERVKKLQEENAKEQRTKTRMKQQEQQEDVKLMEAYARRLAKEDEERMRSLHGKLNRRDMVQSGIAASLQEQLKKKELEDERRAEEYQRQKDDEARMQENLVAERRRREALERKQFLELQRRQKKEREHQEVEEDMKYAEHVLRDGKAAREEQKRRRMMLRQRNLEEQNRLLEQMRQQKEGQPMSPLHLPRTLMSSREKHINAKLLQKLEEPEVAQQVLKKLSPSKEQKEYSISTSFY